MNTVLATVMERTREIGIRRSIGARRFDMVTLGDHEGAINALTGPGDVYTNSLV